MSTPLYVECPACDGGRTDMACLCSRGFVATAYTLERFDDLVKDADRFLVALADCRDHTTDVEEKSRLTAMLRNMEWAVEAARSRLPGKGKRR